MGNGIEIKNPWFLKSLQHRIDAIKSKRDKCKRKSKLIEPEHGKNYWLPSRRWLHFHHLLEDLYRIRRDQTKTYLYTLANKLYKNYDLVSIGDYTPRGGGITKGMRRSMNNESLIGRFKEVLEWVAIKSGKEYLVWNEYKTTKTCSHCSHELDSSLNPSIRSWHCPSCGKHHIRDENAALNGLQKTKEMSGSDLWEIVEITSRRAWRYSGLGIDNIPGMTVDAYALV